MVRELSLSKTTETKDEQQNAAIPKSIFSFNRKSCESHRKTWYGYAIMKHVHGVPPSSRLAIFPVKPNPISQSLF